MIRFKPLPILTALTIAALLALIALGDWQWGRYQEKLAARARGAPIVTLSSAAPLKGRIQLVYALNDLGPLWRVFAPLAHDGVTTFVDVAALGGMRPPDWRSIAEPFGSGAIAVRGAKVTPHPPPWTAAQPDPASHLWFAVDLPAMAHAAQVPNVTDYYIALPYVGPNGALSPNPFADPSLADPLPPERHFGYALTWWGLAATLVGVYAAFHVRLGRLGFRAERQT